MDIESLIGNPRITDYSFRASEYISMNHVSRHVLEELYMYHLGLCIGDKAMYPETNWQSHRLCLMSAIAVKLDRMDWVWQCHDLCMDWIRNSDCNCCNCSSKDYHWRDSCEYKIYGWWGLAAAFVSLQSKTQYPYKKWFTPYFDWFRPYETGEKIHYEYLTSRIASDKDKPHYGKQFDPSYNKNLMRHYNKLKDF